LRKSYQLIHYCEKKEAETMKRLFLLIPLTLLFLLIGGKALAVPAPPEIAVNHETKECAEFFGGDECMSCSPPEGWEILGDSSEVECPAGYTFTSIEPVCRHSKSQFCCSEGHSGASGDCEDMVINKKQNQCAFVEDINACNLPSGWKARPEKTSLYDWTCPGSYTWEDVDCTAPAEGGSDEPSGWLPLNCSGSILLWLLFPGLLLILPRPSHTRGKTVSQFFCKLRGNPPIYRK
jgi:hypothetical protein